MEKKKHIIRLNEAELESLIEEGVKREINEGYIFTGYTNLPEAFLYARKYIKSIEKDIIEGYVDTGGGIDEIRRVLFSVNIYLATRADEAREPEKEEDKPNIFTKLRDKFDEKFGPKIGE